VTKEGPSGRAPADGDLRPMLRLIGGFRVFVDGEDVRVPRSEQRLLALLALHGGERSRSALAESLWPDARYGRPGANLRAVVMRLDSRVRAHVLVRPGSLELAAWDIDVHVATDMANHLDDDALAEAIWSSSELFFADLLPEWDEWWVYGERERYRQVRLHALERLAARHLRMGGADRAVELALKAVDAEPLRESAQYLLIAAYVGEGNRAAAVEQYRRFAKELDAELGVPPGPALTNLVREAIGR
jgi:DNA-binding SARP family transcriptional activator